MSAALDAVKERVTVPWRQSIAVSPSSAAAAGATSAEGRPDNHQSVDARSSVTEIFDATSQEQLGSTLQVDADADTSVSPSAAETVDPAETTAEEVDPPHVRSLACRNFDQALKEITPSASESLGSLAELRKWNDEFGEGRRAKKRQVWGKDRFGFTVPAPDVAPSQVKLEPSQPDVVAPSHPTSRAHGPGSR